MIIVAFNYLEFKNKVEGYTKAQELLKAGNINSFDEVLELLYDEEIQDFIKAVNEGEEAFIAFITKENR